MSDQRARNVSFLGTRSSRAWASAMLAAALTVAPALHAQEAEELTRARLAAEHAYQEIDFPTTYTQAQNALAMGRATVETASRLYVLLGLSAAVLGKSDEARNAFVTALAISPSMRLDRELSPKVRAPYLEAQGFWSGHETRLSLRATPDSLRSRFTVRVEDAANIAREVVVLLRARGASAYETVRFEPAAAISVSVTEALWQSGFEYTARLNDKFGNPLQELGSELEPALVHGRAPEGAAVAETTRKTWPGWVVGTAGLASAGVGTYFFLRRESAARTWNGSSCERAGQTRGEQCADVDADRSRYQRFAIGFYAAGGALIATSVVLLLTLPSSPTEPAHAVHVGPLACDIGLEPRGLLCAGAF